MLIAFPTFYPVLYCVLYPRLLSLLSDNNNFFQALFSIVSVFLCFLFFLWSVFISFLWTYLNFALRFKVSRVTGLWIFWLFCILCCFWISFLLAPLFEEMCNAFYWELFLLLIRRFTFLFTYYLFFFYTYSGSLKTP